MGKVVGMLVSDLGVASDSSRGLGVASHCHRASDCCAVHHLGVCGGVGAGREARFRTAGWCAGVWGFVAKGCWVVSGLVV